MLFPHEPTGLSVHPEARPFSSGAIPVPFMFSPRQNRWLKNTLSRSSGPTGVPGFQADLHTRVSA